MLLRHPERSCVSAIRGIFRSVVTCFCSLIMCFVLAAGAGAAAGFGLSTTETLCAGLLLAFGISARTSSQPSSDFAILACLECRPSLVHLPGDRLILLFALLTSESSHSDLCRARAFWNINSADVLLKEAVK